MMRIISGKYRGRQINMPGGLPVRPTMDMAKEALFNILTNHFDFEEIRVLDLFAGTGSIAFEFASRGVTDITAVDVSNKCTDFIRKTAEQLGIPDMKIFRTNSFNFMQKATAVWDIVFADPPYDLTGFENVVVFALRNKLVKAGGWLIIEHPANYSFSNHPEFSELRTYGKACFSIFKIPEMENYVREMY